MGTTPDLADEHAAHGLPASPEDLDDSDRTRTATSARARLARAWKPLDTLDGIMNEKPAPRPWLLMRDAAHDNEVDTDEANKGVGVLPLGKVGMLVAAGGAGKTMLLVQLGIAVATGKPWLAQRNGQGGFRTPNPGRVVLALGEEDEEEVRRRVYSAAAAMDLSPEERLKALRRIVVLPLAGVPVGLVETDGRGTVTESAFLSALREKLNEPGADPLRLVVLDPLSRFAGTDTETDNAAATRFVQAVETLVAGAEKPTVLLAHHNAKAYRGGPSTSGSQPSPSQQSGARGSSGLTDGVRWVADLYPDGDYSVLVGTKSNYSRRLPETLLVRDKHGNMRVATPAERSTYEATKKTKTSTQEPRPRPGVDPENA